MLIRVCLRTIDELKAKTLMGRKISLDKTQDLVRAGTGLKFFGFELDRVSYFELGLLLFGLVKLAQALINL